MASQMNEIRVLCLYVGELQVHTLAKVSEEPMSATSRSGIAAVASSGDLDLRHILVKTHAAIMVLAWVLCSSVGLIIARSFRVTLGTAKELNSPLWFIVSI